MRGSAAFRASVTPGGALAGPWVRNPLWTAARAVPSLDLRFADNKSLTDAVTGQSLVIFTRASSGTFVGSDGVLRTATTNLCLQSQDFSTTWTNFNSTESVNTAVAPDGTITADTLIPSNGATNGLIRQDFSGSAFTDNASISFSIFVKAAGLTDFNIQFFNKANTFYGTQTINASTGALSGSGTLATTAVTPVGDGWFRVSATGMNSGSGATGPNIRFVVTSTGDGTSGIYLWGAQLEQSSTAGEYIPTTSTINSAPRFDHNPTTGESLGLLVEESRTNLQTQSEAFDQSPWSTVGGTTSTNVIAAPDSTTTADLLTENTTTGQHDVRATSPSLTDAVSYTFSVFAKTNGRLLQIIFPVTASGHGGIFNLTAGTVTVVGTVTATIQAFPNGWYRCIVSGVKSGTGAVTIRLLTHNGTGNSYTGDGTSGIYLWGAQIEAASFPTSYIPTTTATVTRSADVASITGANFSSWYRQDEGALYAAYSRQATNTVGFAASLTETLSASSLNRIQFSLNTSNVPSYALVAAGTTQGTLLPGGTAPNYVTAYSYKLDDLACSSSGNVVVTDTTAVMPTGVAYLNIGANPAGATGFLNGTIRRLTYWPQRLSNSTLQQITQ